MMGAAGVGVEERGDIDSTRFGTGCRCSDPGVWVFHIFTNETLEPVRTQMEITIAVKQTVCQVQSQSRSMCATCLLSNSGAHCNLSIRKRWERSACSFKTILKSTIAVESEKREDCNRE